MQSPTFELKNTLVRAGAGAGKTTELVARVLDFATRYHHQHGKWPRLVVCTFTRKATQELKERILIAAMNHSYPKLLEFAESPSHLHISTIHGVLSLLLSQYGWFDGLVPSFQFISRDQEVALIKKLIRQYLKDSSRKEFHVLSEYYQVRDLLEMFELYRRDASEQVSVLTEEQLRRTAGSLYRQNVKSLQMLGQEIESELTAAKDGKTKQNFLDWVQSLKVFPPDLPTGDLLSDLLKALPKTVNRGELISEGLNERKKALTESLKECSGFSFQPEAWKLFSDLGSSLLILFQNLQMALVAEKKRSGVLTMSDLEDFAYELTQKLPEVVQGFSAQWDYWMIDEFQDTSPKQVAILKALMGDRLQYYVGDPQQSIYLFRGARSEVFFQQEQSIASNQGLALQKMINYRSEKSLLQFFNWFFKNLGSQFSEMQPGNLTHPAESHQVEVFSSEEISDDILAVAAIQSLLARGAEPSEILVLARTNDLLSECGSRLAAGQIPFQILSGGKFFEKAEVRDALSLLKFLVAPQDSVNLVALLRCPYFHVPDSFLQEVRKAVSSQTSLWNQVKHLSHPRIQKLRSFQEMTEEKGVLYVWRDALFQEGYVQGLRQEDPSGRKESNLFKLIHSVFVAERKPDFSVSQFLHQLEVGLEDPESAEGEALPILAPQKVNLMTIHASKGLQAKYVVLLGCGAKPPQVSKASLWISEKVRSMYFGISDDEGQRQWPPGFDSIKEEWRARELEEFDRLLYVALTRAEKSVSLVSSKIQSGSWADRWALPKNEGEHRIENFKVLVQHVNEVKFLKSHSDQIEFANQPLRPRPLAAFNSSKTMKTLSVTALLESNDLTAEALVTPQSEASSSVSSIKKVKRALRGVEIHRVFERLKYTELDIRTQDVALDLKEKINELLAREDVPLRQIIQNGFVEWGFGAKMRNCLVQGQIDLWGFSDSGDLWIVDYKTGNPENSEKAFNQLEIYALALYKVGKTKSTHKIKLCVLYPFDKNPFRVRDCPAFEVIESRLQDI